MPTTTTDLDGLFKEVYTPDGLINLMPEASRLVKGIEFSEDEKIGDKYVQPVALTYEHGITYGAPAAGAFTLRAAGSMKTKKAEVDGYQMVLRSQMDYETAAKAQKGGARSFKKATQLQVENMMESLTKRLELSILYGQSGIGQASSSVNTDATTTVLQISTASWATGIWAGMENCPLNVFNASSGALVSSGADSIFIISKVDVANKKLTVTGTATGISALDTLLSTTAGDIFFDTARASASSYSEMVGLRAIMVNTGSLFGVSASTYNLWAGTLYDVGSTALTFGKIINGIAEASGRGLQEKMVVYLNDKTWANVASDQAALYSQNGEVELQPYNCVKEGEALGLPLKRIKRVGAQDLSFNSLGNDGRIFRELSDGAGFEYRIYSDQSVFCETPAKLILFQNIVNS